MTSSGACRRGKRLPGGLAHGPPVRRSPATVEGDPQAAQHVVIDHHAAAAGQCPYRELLMAGGAGALRTMNASSGAPRERYLVGDGDSARARPSTTTSGLPR